MWQEFKASPFERRFIAVWVVVLIMVLSGINKIVNGHEILSLKDYYAAFYLFPFLILSAQLAYAPKFFRFLLYFTIVEIIVGICEYSVGLRTFFQDIGAYNIINDYSLLYESRVYGMSANSSILGYKILIAFILIDYVKLKTWLSWIIRVLLLVGLIISFSRVAIVVLVLYWGLGLIVGLFKNRLKFFKSEAVVFYLLIISFTTIYRSEIGAQLSRKNHQAESAFIEPEIGPGDMTGVVKTPNTQMLEPGELNPEKQGFGDKLMLGIEQVQSSGRKLIWLNYLNFIENHLWFGNGSDKLMMSSWIEKEKYFKSVHAHNSFLMLFATNGLFIGLLYLVFLALFLKTKNYLAIIAVLMYSMGNFGIFWGFSYMDVIFIILLSQKLKPNYDYARES